MSPNCEQPQVRCGDGSKKSALKALLLLTPPARKSFRCWKTRPDHWRMPQMKLKLSGRKIYLMHRSTVSFRDPSWVDQPCSTIGKLVDQTSEMVGQVP